MRGLLTLKRKLQENPAAFTCDEKVFLKRLLTRDDELCNLRFISKEMVKLLDTDNLTPAALVHRVHTAVSALADVGQVTGMSPTACFTGTSRTRSSSTRKRPEPSRSET